MFLSIKGKVHAAWSEWYVPTRFSGMTYESAQYTNITNIATQDNNAWSRVDVQFGSPAPQTFRHSLGFSNYLEANKTITDVEVKFSARRLYSVSPSETIEMYINKSDATIASALNATESAYYFTPLTTSFVEHTFYWRNGTNDTTVSDYFDNFDPYNFTLSIGLYKNSSSGSTNFVDIGYLAIRFNTTDNTVSNTIANPTTTYLAYEGLKETAALKAPFAYFNAVGDLDFSAIETEDFTINMPVILNGSVTYYPATLPEEMVDALEVLRNLVGIGITGFMIIYFINTGNRIFTGGSI